MKKISKIIICFITLIIGMFIFNEQVYASDYMCPYNGKINGKNLIIEKVDNEWNVTYPDSSKLIFKTSGNNSFPSEACEDVFLVTKNGKTRIVKVVENTLHTAAQISQLCNGYGNEVEQFCNGSCKIDNALCGNTTIDDDFGDGQGCPWELRAVVVFLKRVVFNTVQLFVPIILIVMGTIDFVKAVASPDDKGNKEAISKFIKRCLTAIFVFFIGTVVSIVMNMFANTDVGEKNEWNTCWTSIK